LKELLAPQLWLCHCNDYLSFEFEDQCLLNQREEREEFEENLDYEVVGVKPARVKNLKESLDEIFMSHGYPPPPHASHDLID
jgi:hypothetical protein